MIPHHLKHLTDHERLLFYFQKKGWDYKTLMGLGYCEEWARKFFRTNKSDGKVSKQLMLTLMLFDDLENSNWDSKKVLPQKSNSNCKTIAKIS